MNRLFLGLCAAALGGAVALQLPAAAIARSKETVLHSFGSGTDGEDPSAGLIDVNGTLYGTTYGGGTSGAGTVFSVDPTTGAETVVYSFTGRTDGARPYAGLIDVKGTLDGTTYGGGTDDDGTVFSVDPKTGAETVVYSFTGFHDGAGPEAGLIDVKGTLYGTTLGGGADGVGTVFSVDRTTGAETVVYSFTGGMDGESPYAGLIDVKGTLYGTTYSGGTYDDGTVFSVDRKTGAETVAYSFTDGTDGNLPTAELVDVKGTLFGTTVFGGGYGYGTVFSLDRKTGAERVVYSFTGGKDGGLPSAGVVDVNGTLYGTAPDGGTGNDGTVFSVNRKTGAEKMVYSFKNGTDGEDPWASLIDVNGTLYGTTRGGGTYSGGTVFALKNP